LEADIIFKLMRKSLFSTFLFCAICNLLFAQPVVDSIPSNHSKKIKKVVLLNAAIYGGSITALYSAWYKDYPQSNLHSFDDWDEWQQMDKIGHLYSAYTMSRFGMEMWRNTGISRKKRIWLGGLSGAAYQTVIEVLDAYSAQWGWSWGDVGGNVLGSTLFVGQEFAWDEQRIQLKTSFHKKNYNDATLDKRANQIFGKSLPERFLKDYNGQTYWLSVNIPAFFPDSKLPKWLSVAVGTGAEGMFGARSNVAKDAQGMIVFDRSDLPRYRQWYLSPDIDFTKIKTNRKGLKFAFFVLNALKFPSPAIEFTKSNVKIRWISF
jgi:hypothetical protein